MKMMRMKKFFTFPIGSDLPLFERAFFVLVSEMLYFFDCGEDYKCLAREKYIEAVGMLKGFLYSKSITSHEYDLLLSYLQDCYNDSFFEDVI